MASLTQEIVIKNELRPCIAKGKKALFHKWIEEANIAIKLTYALVEFENGVIKRVDPEEVTFCDGKLEMFEKETALFKCEGTE